MLTLAASATAAPAAQSQPVSRAQEGDWYISDSTDNNTGEREVSATKYVFPEAGREYVTLTMRCSSGRPTFFVEWNDLTFPDQTVITIGSIVSAHSANPPAKPFVFEKSADVIERGLKASPQVSTQIVATIGAASYATFTAHLPSASRTIEIEVEGTQRAWARVSRHCPIKIVFVPAP